MFIIKHSSGDYLNHVEKSWSINQGIKESHVFHHLVDFCQFIINFPEEECLKYNQLAVSKIVYVEEVKEYRECSS